MLRYTMTLRGYERRDEGLPGALVRDLLDALDQGARGAVRLRLEGRSRAGGGASPAWLGEAAGFEFVGLLPGAPGIELRAPTLGEALPERFARLDRTLNPGDTAIALMARGLSDAMRGDEESDAYDEGLLRAFEGFRALFHHGVESVEVRNARPRARVLRITPAGMEAVRSLQRKTPRRQRILLAGKVDAIRHSDRVFTLVLKSGATIRGVLTEGAPEDLAQHFGGIALVSGYALFRPSGSVLRIDAERLDPGGEKDLAMWSAMPRSFFGRLEPRQLRRPQGPRTGLNAIIGKWPGDETDEEILAIIEEMS